MLISNILCRNFLGRVMVLLKLNVLKKQILYSFLIGRHSNLVSFLHTDMTKKEAFKLGSSLKFMFSKKATKIETNLHHWLDTYLVNVKLTVKVWSIFEAFLENMNFTCSNQLCHFFFKRLILNGILKSQIDYLQEFLNVLEERQTARKSSKSNQQAMYAEIPDHHKQLFRRLVSDGMNPTVEDKLLYMKDNLIKIAKHRAMKMVSLYYIQ